MTSSPLPHADQALALAHQRGVLRASDLQALGIPQIVLARLTASGRLERIARGLYRLPGQVSSEHETLTTVARRVPQAVFCLLTALQFHGLTTQMPREVWITMPRGSHVPQLDYPPLHMVQCPLAALGAGVEHVTRDQVVLQVYGVARTVADCFKFRNRIGLDVAIEALKDALEQKKTTADELWHFATLGRVANLMRPYLEALQ